MRHLEVSSIIHSDLRQKHYRVWHGNRANGREEPQLPELANKMKCTKTQLIIDEQNNKSYAEK